MKEIFAAVCFTAISSVLVSQQQPSPVIDKAINPLAQSYNEIDKNLRINYPLLGQKVRGKIMIKGAAKPGSNVTITVTSTYYKLGTDQKKRKLFKGEGPLSGAERTIKLKVNGQGFWSTDFYNFRNTGWSEDFKIVLRSVEGKNATYVTVKDETKPIVEWD